MLRAESRWGSSFVTTLSEDLREAIPNAKGFSKTNLFYMIGFYRLYHTSEEFPQVEGKIDANEKFPQVGGKLEALLKNEINQVEVDTFSIPWGHHKLIMDRCKDDKEKALFFVQKTLENNWSRAVLMNFHDTNLYERQGKAISNFDKTLPSPQSDLAQYAANNINAPIGISEFGLSKLVSEDFKGTLPTIEEIERELS